MELDIYQVDAFSSGPFSGNPAGVCITPSALNPILMQNIAAEMAVSETAFLSLDNYRLRWFTPRTEVDLCGHATLATGHILRQSGRLDDGETATFTTLSGPLQARVAGRSIQLDFPQLTPHMSLPPDKDRLAALGLAVSEIADYGLFGEKQLIVVHDERIMTSLQPDFGKLLSLPGRGIAVTAKSRGEYSIISRYFAPWVGINEDPVTGSAHCALAVYWSAKLGEQKLSAYQASSRGGALHLTVTGSGRVLLSGEACTVLAGKLYV
ncbi:PhzF family phenazine biosynthesis protein [Martelella alba]|uniref:PhzF family phenazine biosynthesis protein n=1 Tax=Martelella alba TaxID=2590451 RepID=A0ABY2SKG2_9HYPH|nr:PhzF family phenazine biosynthesis protein [Martelella alba]TKI06068.1 PhzF family phenazine biosynthesis protein [Martelella alba]